MNVEILDQVKVTQTERWCWFPTVCQFSTGEVLAQFWMAPDEVDPESAMTGYCVSPDGGKTWGPRLTKGFGGHCHFPFDDGSMLEIGYQTVPQPLGQAQELRVTRILYREAGRSLERSFGLLTLPEPVKLVEPSPRTGSRSPVGLVFDHSIIRANGGSLLATMYGHFERDELYRSILVRSTDEGRNWQYFSTIASVESDPADDMGPNGLCEPSAIRLANGDLFCIMRTGSNSPMFQCRSSDDGVTWDEPRSAGLKGVQPDLCLLSDGVLACSYGRPGPVSLAFSEDGTGSAWTNVTEIFAENSTRYTGMVEVEPNVILLVYDSVPKGWQPIAEQGLMNSIRCALVRVEC